jgi:hypothetical protein
MPINNKEIMESTFPLSKPKTLKLMLGGDSQEKNRCSQTRAKIGLRVCLSSDLAYIGGGEVELEDNLEVR